MISFKKSLPLSLIFLALIPAFFWNLGKECLIEDEGIRGLVAQEMMLSGNYVTPTLQSEFYYKKPPVYNWMIVLSFNLHGDQSELALRVPVVLFLFLFALVVWWVGHRELDSKIGLLSALALLTNGRILFYDSMRGLIDTSFSLVIFLLFYVVYRMSKQHNWLKMFVLAYLLATFAFLLKGLPAFAFLGITLLVWLIQKGAWRQLFSINHAAGIGLSCILLGSYLLIYAQFNDPKILLKTFLMESSNATPISRSLTETIQHIFTFPFDLIYHFLPWTLLGIFLIKKGWWQKLKKNDFLFFCVLVGLSNLVLYWISPRVFPRYLFMFLPLLFFVFFSGMKDDNGWRKQVVHITFGILVLIVALAIPFSLLNSRIADQPFSTSLLSATSIAGILIVWFYIKQRENRMLWFVLFLLVLRIGFNGLIIPARVSSSYASSILRPQTVKAAKKFEGNSIHIIGKEMDYWHHSYYTNSFYITRETKKQLKRVERENLRANQIYLLDPIYDQASKFVVLDSFPVRHNQMNFYFVKMRD